MMFFYNSKIKRFIAIILLFNLPLQLFHPTIAYALTSGPSQPEFSSFEPVGVSDLVNKFTGDFTYSIPVLEVPGPQGSSYPLNLSYRSGENAEDEASWVGYGWNLNPGAINRSTRGLPDDFSDEPTTYYNQVPDNYTLTAGGDIGVELFSRDRVNATANANIAIRYNNYMGFGYNRGFGISIGRGLISLGASQTDGRTSYSASVNPMAILSMANFEKNENVPEHHTYKGKEKRISLEKSIEKNMRTPSASIGGVSTSGDINLFGGGRGILDFNESSRSTQTTKYTGDSYNVTIGASVNPGPIPVGVTGNLTGSYTVQRTVPEQVISGYGYLYTADAAGQSNRITDYYTEKDAPYNKRDVFLGVPFANADIYNVSGEGIGGTFQVHHSKTGDFSPNTVESTTNVWDIGADVSFGWTFGGGAKIKGGKQKLTESSWDKTGNLLPYSSPSTRESYFRFANDLGGMVGHDLSNDAPVAAGLNGNIVTGYTINKNFLKTLTGQNPVTSAPLAGPSQGSHIGQHTVQEVASPRGAMFRYCKRADIEALRYTPPSQQRLGQPQNKAIAELCVTNESGTRYTYGLPLYAKNEVNLQYGLKGPGTTLPIDKNFIVYTDKQTIKVGEKRDAAYATSYLLTDIAAPDYIDRTLNGASEDDFGAYTAFFYQKQYGHGSGNSTWFHWRFPYTGHVFSPNSSSDPDDDMAAVSEGDKEIAYLKAVQTKTHTAVFTTSARQDGFDASLNARVDFEARGNNSLSKLDKIDLYANTDIQFNAQTGQVSSKDPRNPAPKPIKTVVFNYNYTLCAGTPNSFPGINNVNPSKGKLTLVSITTLYNGIQTTKPYVFGYAYPNYDLYPGRYEATLRAGYDKFPATAQNPLYNRFSMDAWGSYQGYGEARYEKMQTWPSQRQAPIDFDPAAWQLKVIRLPSGGEIHVQYEQDDYAYVQDKTAHALAELSADGGNSPEDNFLIDPSSVGITSAADITAACALIKKLYVEQKQKIYFRFLYKLVGSNAPNTVTSCNSDYISGYVTVREVRPDGNKIRILIGKPSRTDYTLPRQVCWDFTQTQRLGKLQDISQDNCDPAIIGFNEKEQNITRLFRQFAAWAPRALSPLNSKDNLCKTLNPSLSYFKIPLPTSKKGGGLRVKRLLTYDKGLDNVPVLYGSEYEYKAYDDLTKTWRSSGVATTEPGTMRMENALVSFIPRLSQSSFEKIISGPDRKQSEGPIGESIMPAAMVGYSRVTVKNIHSGKTNPGYSITEYFTCKDAPVRWYKTSINSQVQYRTLSAGLVSLFDNNMWATQGFSFILNNMHGQIKREATYAGSYADINEQVRSTLISEQKYEYFDPEKGDRIRLQDEAEDEGTLLPERVFPGKEVQVTTAQRAVRDNTTSVSGEGDVQITPFAVYVQIWVTASASVSRFNSEFYTHTTSKIIRYPAIVKQISSFHDGVRDTVENLAFDRFTGSPVAVRTSDTKRGAYLKQDVMASWVYPQLQGKALNEGLVLGGTSTSPVAQIVTGPVAGASYLKATTPAYECSLLASVRKGDVLALGTTTNTLYFADAPDVARKIIRLYPFSPTAGTNLPNSTVPSVSIVFSGNTNELRAQAGSTTYHGSIRKELKFTPVDRFNLDATGNSTDPLARALQDAIRGLPAAPSTGTAERRFSISGQEFSDVNVSGFVDRISAPCRSSASQAKIRNLNFVAYQDATAGTVRIQLISFELLCPGSGYMFVQ